MSESATFSIRVPQEFLDRIDQAAQQAGETRSTYILSWLPVSHDTTSHTPASDTPNTPNAHHNNAR